MPLLPVRLMPSAALPSMTVSFSMYGASPRTVEAEVTSRLESALARVRGVKAITSRSTSRSGYINIELDRHADLDKIRFEVSAIMRQIWDELPDNVTYPVIVPHSVGNDNDGPFMVLTLNSAAGPTEILKYGEENLKPVLAKIEGVSDVTLSGVTPFEWKLNYDIDQLNALGISPNEIQKALSEYLQVEYIAVAPSFMSGISDSYGYVRLALKSGDRSKPLDLDNISVSKRDGGWIPLSQLVSAEHVESQPYYHFRINGLNSIYVSISADENANQLDLSKKVKKILTSFRVDLPEGYSVETTYDSAEDINDELYKIFVRSGLTIMILLLFVGMASLSWRYVLMISIGICINIAIALLLYYLGGVEIHLYSLAGITISLNLIIDNLIVMVDHYTRHHDRRVFTSIFAATLTTVGALSIVYLMDETTRISLKDFVSVVIINLSVSLLVALFLVPALTEKLCIYKKKVSIGNRKCHACINLLMAHAYRVLVRFIIRIKWIMYLLVAIAFGWTTFLFVTQVYDGKYWNRDKSEPVIHIYATLPNGATISQMDALIRKMESFLQQFHEVEQFQTRIYGANRALIDVRFTKANQYNGFPYRLKSDIISKALTLGGGDWRVSGLDNNGFSNSVMENAGSYRIKLMGYNYDELNDWAMRFSDSLLAHRRIKEVTISSEFSYWKTDYSEFFLKIDRNCLAEAGLSATQLFAAISPVFGRGIECGSIINEGNTEHVRLYSRQSDSYDLYSLMHIPFMANGSVRQMKDFATIEKIGAPKDILKRNQQYELCLQYEYIGSDKQGKKILEKELKKINSLMPPGYKAVDDEENWRQKDDTRKYWLLGLVVVIIFFITSILFNSLREPFIIIFMIPVSFIGVFATFSIFDLKFDQGGFASMILLAGITVNASIYIISEYNSLLLSFPKRSPLGLYLRALRVKIVPILLTVMSTILGFLPFLISSEKESFWFPLAAGTIGGLLVSIPGLLIYLPLLLPRYKRK